MVSANALSADINAMIAQVGSHKEGTKMETSTLRRNVDLYRRQTKTLLSQGYSAENFQKFRQYFRTFNQEVASRLGDMNDVEQNESDESYNVLKLSLEEAQKRCEHLNENMLKVADANGDLLHTLDSLKNANRRLVDQLEQQSAEVSRLEQQAVLGEEKMLSVQRCQEEDMDQWRAEAQFKLEDYNRIHEEQFENMVMRNKAKIAHAWETLSQIFQRVQNLGEERALLKEDILEQSDKIARSMTSTVHDITTELENLARSRRNETTNLKDVVHNLSVKLETENELHEEDLTQWKHRVDKAEVERDDTNQRLEAAHDGLRLELQKIEMTGEDQHLSSQNVCKELCFRSEELAGDIASLTAMIEISKCKATQMLNCTEALERENIKTDDQIGRIRSECADLEISLRDAMQSFEQLTEQMAQMRRDAQEENERDLSQCKELYDRKMELQRTSHTSELHFYDEESNRMSNTLSKGTNEEQMRGNRLDNSLHQRTMLQRVCGMWKQHYEESTRITQKTADELKQNKVQCDYAIKELEERRSTVLSKHYALQQSLDQITEDVKAYQASSKEKIRSSSKQAESLQSTHVEAEETLEETLKSLKETTAQLQATKSEIAQEQSAALQKQNELNREIDMRQKQNEETLRAYEEALSQEQKLEERLSSQYQRLKEDSSAEVKRWSEVPQSKISAMEREMEEVSMREKAELVQLNAQNQATLRELTTLTEEYHRQKHKHNG